MAEQQITTAEGLDALPMGSVVLDRRGEAWQKVRDTERVDSDGDRLASAWACPAWKQDRTAAEMFSGLPGAATPSGVGPFTLLTPAPAPADQGGREALSGEQEDAARQALAGAGLDEADAATAFETLTPWFAAQPKTVTAEERRKVAAALRKAYADSQGYDVGDMGEAEMWLPDANAALAALGFTVKGGAE